jgi:hypothetical protein
VSLCFGQSGLRLKICRGSSERIELITDVRLSFNGKRILVAIALCTALICLANYYLDLGLFGRLDKKILVMSVGLLIIVALFFAPSIKDMEDYRDKKRISPK